MISVRTRVLVLFCLICLTGFTQNLLVLEKTRGRRWLSYQEGDRITLVTKKDSLTIQDYIIRIEEAAVVVRGDFRIPLEDISQIERFYKHRKNNAIILMAAGGLVVGITSINNALNGQPVLDPLFLSIGAGLAGAGGLWYTQALRKYKLGTKWRLKVLELN